MCREPGALRRQSHESFWGGFIMRLILLLLALALVGLLVARSLHHPVSPAGATPQAHSTSGPPGVPTTAQGLPGFQKNMSSFVHRTEQQQKQRIRRATR